MKDLYESGIIFRGFTIVNYAFRDYIEKTGKNISKDLRSSFIAGITQFIESAFQDGSLEYLESKDVLFIFTLNSIQSCDTNYEERIIAYAICDKKKGVDKQVNKVKTKLVELLDKFIEGFCDRDFTEVNQFEEFNAEIKAKFEK